MKRRGRDGGCAMIDSSVIGEFDKSVDKAVSLFKRAMTCADRRFEVMVGMGRDDALRARRKAEDAAVYNRDTRLAMAATAFLRASETGGRIGNAA